MKMGFVMKMKFLDADTPLLVTTIQMSQTMMVPVFILSLVLIATAAAYSIVIKTEYVTKMKYRGVKTHSRAILI